MARLKSSQELKESKERRLVRNFEQAAVELSWLGRAEASEHAAIYKKAKKALLEYIKG